MRRDGKDLLAVYDGYTGIFVERPFPACGRSRETPMPVTCDTVAVNREPVNGLSHRMPAGVGGHILIVTRPENIQYDADLRNVGRP